LLFILLDLPGLAGWGEHARQEIVIQRTAMANRFLESAGEAS
jgi:hypothetical protein